MTNEVAEAIEFRCTSCWQPNFVAIELSGAVTQCSHCQAEVTVPEATPDRIRSADVLEEQSVENPYAAPTPEPVATPQMSDAELMKLVQVENNVAFSERDFQGYPNASLLSRFIASILDSLYLCFSFVLGIVGVLVAGQAGIVTLPSEGLPENPDLMIAGVFYFFPIVALIVQWNLIATRGQSIGKFITCIRIVTVNGRLPGFFMGVVVRNWVRNLLAIIPFFGLIDLLPIFGDAKRCIHDYMAGTRVVQA